MAVKLIISRLFKAADVVLCTAVMKNFANSYLTALETCDTDKLKCLRTTFNLRHGGRFPFTKNYGSFYREFLFGKSAFHLPQVLFEGAEGRLAAKKPRKVWNWS